MKDKNLYEKIERDITRLENSSFTIDDLRDVVNILVDLEKAYSHEIPLILHYQTSPGISYPKVEDHPDGIKAKEHYEKTKDRIVKMVYNKLRENLDFSELTILKLTDLVMHIKEKGERIDDIYVMNNQFALLASISLGTARGVIPAPIETYDRIKQDVYNSEYIISPKARVILNNIYDYLMTIPGYDKDYDMSDILRSIYFTRPLNEIENSNGDTTVIIYTWDKLYSVIVRNYDGNIKIIDNNEEIVSLADKLNKTKQK